MKICSVEICQNPVLARGLCRKHYQARGRVKKREEYTERGAILKWINDHLSYDGDDCLFWPFMRSVQTNGYGCFKKNKKQHMAHKYICTEVHGPQPEAKSVVRHLCGNGMAGCVNPKHLAWGTQKQNAYDALLHGTRCMGEDQGSSVLKEEEVLEIYRRAWSGLETQAEISEDYKVAQTQVSRIKLGKQWNWLTKHRTEED